MAAPICFSVFLLALLAVTGIQSQSVIERVQKLNNDDYIVKWRADLRSEIVSFEVTARTTGFIGFGLSPQGGMSNADIVTGGVKDGVSYFDDRFATRNGAPAVDASQDWHLISASENSTHTTLSFLRVFDTCDEQDLPINNDTTKFIWAIGATDEVSYHGANRGAASVNILDPSPPVVDVSEFDVWHLSVNTTMPSKDTTYWCTAHKSPSYTSKRHIVGFRPKLDNTFALAHDHHMILHHCSGTTPELIEFYEGFVGRAGGECYNGGEMYQMMQTCETYMYVWGKGGDALFLPTNIGIPLNEAGDPEYFILEIHYDNPAELSGVQYDTGLEVYTTDKIREIDAGVLKIGQAIDYTLMIPPSTTNFTIAGHCSSDCTQSQLPEDGINLFNVLLHSHLAGRQLKLRHFRDGVELPWVSYDNHYDFDYQQNRALPDNRKVLRGDHLTFECVDENLRTPPRAVLGGLSTEEEMCDAYILYYPRLKNLEVCSSRFTDFNAMGPLLGIQGLYDPYSRDPVVSAPAEYAGKHFSDVVSNYVQWDDALRTKVGTLLRFGTHDASCMAHRHFSRSENSVQATVTYPEFIPYEPVATCKANK